MEHNNALRKGATAVLCVLLMLSVLAAVLVLDARTLTARENLRGLISSALTGSAPARLPRSGALAAGIPGARMEKEETRDNAVLDSLTDIAYATLTRELGDNFDISREAFEALLEKTTLLDFASDKAADILSDVCTGSLTTTLTGQEVRAVLEENREVIERELSVTLSEANMQAAANWVERSNLMDVVQDIVLHPGQVASGEIVISQPGVDSVATHAPALTAGFASFAKAVQAIQVVTAPAMLIGVLLACAIFTALLFVVNRKRIPTALLCSGGIYLAAGILTTLPWAAAVCVPSLWQGGILRLVGQALRHTGLVGGITCLLGAALIAAGIVLKTTRKRKPAQV